MALAEDDGDTALEYLLASAAVQEVNPETHLSLAQAFTKLGRSSEALRALERTLRQSPHHAAAKELRETVLSDIG